MVILIVGMYRSGSTWLYNVCRVASHLALPDVAAGHASDKEELLKHKNVVIKSHEMLDDLAESAYVIGSFRDIRDIVCSHRRIRGPLANPSSVDDMLAHYMGWRPFLNYEMRYELMVRDPEAEINRILAGLATREPAFAGLDARRIFEEVDDLRSDPENFSPTIEDHHPVTLLHKNHIGRGKPGAWETELSANEAKELTRKYEAVLRLTGYLKP